MTRKPLNAEKICENVYWVGAIDWSVRNFHGYLTSRGTTYNAYLILDEKITLIDTVKAPFYDEMMMRIASVVDPTAIDYIISNHAEMDHTGALTRTIDAVVPEKVFASKTGIDTLDKHLGIGHTVEAVENNSTLSLGKMSLRFVETRMVHWPESMVSLLVEPKVLFSQDAFGMHLATVERFNDEWDASELKAEAKKYYANILMPLARPVDKAVGAVAGLVEGIEMIAPDHGPIWRTGIERILNLYRQWGRQEPKSKAVIVYDTMWGSTASMARAIADGLRHAKVSARVMPLDASHRSNVAAEVLDAGALIVGGSTLNRNMFPSLADILTYLRGLRPQNLIGAAFSSYGWHDAACEQINAYLKDMSVELVHDGLSVQYVPDESELEKCFKLGVDVGEQLRAISGGDSSS